jgi:ABC-type molybdate transport system substrate-binding protein
MISPMTKYESVFAAQIKTEKKQKEKVKMTVEYNGKIYRDLETHYYLFSTSKKGTIDISWGPDTLGSDYIITDKNWSAMYGNGNELPAGDYMLVITSNPAESPEDPSLISYHFILKGLTFKEAPDTTLPKLTIESPAQLVTHLPAGEHDVTFKGCSDAASLNFTDEETTEQLPNSFEKSIHFDESSPNYRAYRITATNVSGNSVNRYFEFMYDGGIPE